MPSPADIDSGKGSTHSPADLQIGWRRLAVASSIAAAGSLVALTILAATKNADVLSTVALALAVIAFGAQLVVFIAQSQTTSQQMVQAERLNTDTRSALVEVRATSQAILRTMSEQFQPVLESLIGQVSGKVVQASTRHAGLSPSELRREIENSARKAVEDAFATQLDQARTVLAPSPAANTYTPPRPSPEAEKELEIMKSYPDEAEGRELYRLIRGMDPFAIGALAHRARVEKVQREFAEVPGIFANPDGRATRQLVAAGLWGPAEAPEGETSGSPNDKWFRLTNKGLKAASLFEAEEQLPEWLKEEMTNE